jgi:predicted  nucleic acid-binding Zn-ribbon protein
LDKFKTLQELKATFALMKKEKRQIQEDDSTFDKNIRALRQNLQEVQDKQSTLETGLQKIFEEREWQNIYFGN